MVMRTTKEVVARFLPERIFDNPLIKDCLIKALTKIATERAPYEIHRIDDESWSIVGQRGPHQYQWVKLGEEKYPAKWLFGKLLGMKESDSVNTQYAKDFFKALGLETR